MFYLCKLEVLTFFLVPRILVIFPAPSVVQIRIPTGILHLEEVEFGLGTGLFGLMLHIVAQHPGNGWLLAGDLISSL